MDRPILKKRGKCYQLKYLDKMTVNMKFSVPAFTSVMRWRKSMPRILFNLLLSAVLAAMLKPTGIYAVQGAGPDDIYGGAGARTRTTARLIISFPRGTPDREYYFYPRTELSITDPDHYAYWTQGNNISRMITNEGLHNDVSAWQQGGLSCIYPRGSAYRLIRSLELFFNAVGEFNGQNSVYKDTARVQLISGLQCAGQISTDLSYTDPANHDERWKEKYLEKTDYLRVSTRPEDLAEWPEAFRDENNQPLVISDEDVVVTYTGLGFAMAGADGEQRSLWDGTKASVGGSTRSGFYRFPPRLRAICSSI